MTELVVVDQLKYSWDGKQPWLLDIPDFVLQKGEKVFLHGPSGSGKSTFLNILGGVLQPYEGQLKILGKDFVQMSPGQKDIFRGDHLGFVFQMFNLLPYYTTLENILLPLRFSKSKAAKVGNPKAEVAEAQRIAKTLRLSEDVMSKSVTELSVGQQQRVAVARALMGRPELIIADEPTSSLDASAQQAFLDLLFSECDRYNIGLIFVSHDMSLGKNFNRVISLAEINQGTRISKEAE